jgi:HEAT repeat protein
MIAQAPIQQRHPATAELVTRAAAGDLDAAHQVIAQLGTDNAWLQQMIVETLQDTHDPNLWRRLIMYLALQRWDEQHDWQRPIDPPEVQRHLTTTLIDLFVKDEGPLAESVTPVKIAVLHELLNHPGRRVNSAAACLLGLRGEIQSVEVLVETVRSGDVPCKLRAMRALAHLKAERSGPALVEALASEDEQIHWEAGRALAEMGAPAVPALLGALTSPVQHVRWHAAHALGQIGDPRAAPGLAATMGDLDYGVRWAAADVLGRMGENAIPAILEQLARHPITDGVREAALHALNQMQPAALHERLRPLIETLRGPGGADAAPTVAFSLLNDWRR